MSNMAARRDAHEVLTVKDISERKKAAGVRGADRTSVIRELKRMERRRERLYAETSDPSLSRPLMFRHGKEWRVSTRILEALESRDVPAKDEFEESVNQLHHDLRQLLIDKETKKPGRILQMLLDARNDIRELKERLAKVEAKLGHAARRK